MGNGCCPAAHGREGRRQDQASEGCEEGGVRLVRSGGAECGVIYSHMHKRKLWRCRRRKEKRGWWWREGRPDIWFCTSLGEELAPQTKFKYKSSLQFTFSFRHLPSEKSGSKLWFRIQYIAYIYWHVHRCYFSFPCKRQNQTNSLAAWYDGKIGFMATEEEEKDSYVCRRKERSLALFAFFVYCSPFALHTVLAEIWGSKHNAEKSIFCTVPQHVCICALANANMQFFASR